MSDKRMCLLDETKVCDDCGECDRCDLDPNKICDNCCRCIAIEDEGREFRSLTVNKESFSEFVKPQRDVAPLYKKAPPVKKQEEPYVPDEDEPLELTPELLEKWERILIEHGEAPADDGFGEIEVAQRVPVHGARPVNRKRKRE